MVETNRDLNNELLRSLLAESDYAPLEPGALVATEEGLLAFAQAHAVQPPAGLRFGILAKIQSLNIQKATRTRISLDAVPMLTADANHLDWAEAVAEIPAPEVVEDVYLHAIRADEQVEIFVAWVKEEIATEVHHDLLESFILLEGSCECFIQHPDGASRTVHMREGDYISFQLGEVHDIQITSAQPAKAILQWLKVAA